jgi:hypothetical protein
MEQITQLLMVKASAVLLLSLLVSACGITVEDDEMSGQGRGVNRVVATSDGAYGMQLNSTALTCRGFDDFAMRSIAYKHSADPSLSSDPDEGLEVGLDVFGDVDAGDTLTSDNASEHQYFTFHMVTPEGDLYDYSSLGGTAAPTLAVLTVLAATDFELSVRLSVESLASVRGGAPASFRGTFQCSAWQGTDD